MRKLSLFNILLVCFLLACHRHDINDTEKQIEKPKIVQEVSVKNDYQVSEAEKAYLTERFTSLKAVNPEVIAYIYIPGTQLDEPVVQTGDNATYLDKTFEGVYQPLMGAVFMDMDNRQTFQDQLTWLFGHARGSMVPDHRMFNDLNFYDNQTFFDDHPYVVIETPERKYYYEAAFFLIVPEDTPLYQTHFDDESAFAKQLSEANQLASVRNPEVLISPKEKYLVLSTCREYDDTLRANLYLRQIPDKELSAFLASHGEQLAYQPTR